MSDLGNITIVSRHLPAGYSAQFDADASSAVVENSAEVENGSQQPGQESSLKLQGGDIHRDLFRLRERPRDASLQRSRTFGHYSTLNDDREAPEDGGAADHQTPGAFRRQFVQRKASRFSTTNLPVTRDFIEFLDLYGSFAGEELGESDDEDASVNEPDNDTSRPSERRPLLGTRKSTRRGAKAGDAGTTKTFFTLLKAFIGTGIMFLPKAFNNGGILFSSIVLLSVAAISMLAFHLLLQCRTKYGGGYGDLGKAIAGPRARSLILASITLSQLGFVCAGIVFVAQNLYSFSVAVAETDSSPIPMRALIAIQAIVLIPLAFIRNISKLGPAALLADAFILIGLTYIYQFDISTIAHSGIAPSVRLFNPDSFTLTIGSAIFTFEGIGLILPIQSSMKKPERFEYLLGIVMFLATSIFASVGVLCYATFGEDTKIEIISNYPQTDKLVNAVQFLYSIAVLVGNPVQLFPAIRILEGAIFGHLSGKKDTRTKWIKNAFRSGLVLLCVGISIAGASDLDRFVALIGSFACVPLVYIYPPFLHYKGVATSKLAKAGDIAFVVLGLVAMAYTTVVTVANSFS
ncbi:transmembrane amino acid transporter protein-domain-containing protein [Elsinoe ampelina]|uniref:Transmembrane amino acid transporter protein-domain-containing protein n=1 Tax=Elsinoe ampelina TaxID=302913 RepID=A0A6A6FZU7_9PEZI|nr:transmembrane amino acid transporter protein-domain-containing protein [Elsinoe ampelina]